MRIAVFILLALILLSLGSALVYLYRGGGKPMVRSLTLRVGLSLVLFLLLVGGYYFGLIGPRL